MILYYLMMGLKKTLQKRHHMWINSGNAVITLFIGVPIKETLKKGNLKRLIYRRTDVIRKFEILFSNKNSISLNGGNKYYTSNS